MRTVKVGLQMMAKGCWLLAFVGLWTNSVLATDTMRLPQQSHSVMSVAMSNPPVSVISMQGGSAPKNTRSPHAYANDLSLTTGPYLLADAPRLSLADEDTLWGVSFNRFEWVEADTGDTGDAGVYDAQAWYGYTYDRAVIKAEGEYLGGSIVESHTELLYSHALTAFWDIQSGIRHDSSEGPDRNWLVLGFQGMSPYWFEIDGAVYIGEQGRSMLQIEVENEWLLTQRLILQPRAEFTFYGQQDEAIGVGSGLSSTAVGLRLRYEVTRQLAPYIGVEWTSQFGDTASYSRAMGGGRQDTQWLVGLRFWL